MWVGIWTFENCSYYICLFLLCVGVGGYGHNWWHSWSVEIRGQLEAISFPSTMWVLGIKLRSPNLAASLTFIYSFSLECTWVFPVLEKWSPYSLVPWYELWAVLIELCSDPLPRYLNELFLSCSLWATLEDTDNNSWAWTQGFIYF